MRILPNLVDLPKTCLEFLARLVVGDVTQYGVRKAKSCLGDPDFSQVLAENLYPGHG